MAQATEYHWIITLELPGRASATFSGVAAVPPGQTRSEVYNGIRRELAAEHPELERANTAFFSLEPNQL